LVNCGGGGTAMTTTSPFCGGCQFVVAATNSGQILAFRVSQGGELGAPTSTPRPSNSTGLIAVGPSSSALYFLYISDPQNDSIRV
jgi:hypothetical protein